jgi:geranylgeranyl diphosphate synthase type I
MIAMARDRADRAQAARIRELFGDADLDDAGAAELRSIITATGARQRIEDLISLRASEAMTALADAPLTVEARSALTALASSVVARRR